MSHDVIEFDIRGLQVRRTHPTMAGRTLFSRDRLAGTTAIK